MTPLKQVVCQRDDLAPNEKRIVQVHGRAVVLVRKEDQFFALHNVCPHRGAPLGKGRLVGTFLPSNVGEWCFGKEGGVLRCPWHRWEYDVETGRSLHDPEHTGVRTFQVSLEGDDVVVSLVGAAEPGLNPGPLTAQT